MHAGKYRLDEFDIYQDGKVVLEIEDIEPEEGRNGVGYAFSHPELFAKSGLDLERIET